MDIETPSIVETTHVEKPVFLSWNTLEFEPKDRHPDWIWYASLIALIIAIVAFFFGNIFFGIFAIIAGITVVIYARRAPHVLAITLSGKGININEELYLYKNIQQFWLDETGKPDKLLLLVKSSLVTLLVLPLEGVTAQAVRSILEEKEVVQIEMRESTSVVLFDRLGF